MFYHRARGYPGFLGAAAQADPIFLGAAVQGGVNPLVFSLARLGHLNFLSPVTHDTRRGAWQDNEEDKLDAFASQRAAFERLFNDPQEPGGASF